MTTTNSNVTTNTTDISNINDGLNHSTITSYTVTGNEVTLPDGGHAVITFQTTLHPYYMLCGAYDNTNTINIIGAPVFIPIGADGTVSVLMSYVCVGTGGATKTFTPMVNIVGIMKHPKMPY